MALKTSRLLLTSCLQIIILWGTAAALKQDVNAAYFGRRHDGTSLQVPSRQQQVLLLRQRQLNFDVAPLSSQGRIAWFCFVAVCVIAPLLCCMVFCALKLRSRQEEARAEEEEQANTAISRIEANVKVFEEIEGQRRMQCIRRTMKRHLFVLKKEDLCTAPLSEDETSVEVIEKPTKAASIFRKELSSGCSICLESFQAGDTLMHSIDVDECRHVFHEMCVCEWLVKQSTSVCPCCRQEFVGVETPVTSVCSQEQFQAAFEPEQGTVVPPLRNEGEGEV